ncbi:Peptidoglycan-binding domain 1 protein [candidate division TM7 genomosp. GTL1]|nr:Peptidoglycan-binding domain 1 protein [candidate division TM7 genomosp. GTL1]
MYNGGSSFYLSNRPPTQVGTWNFIILQLTTLLVNEPELQHPDILSRYSFVSYSEKHNHYRGGANVKRIHQLYKYTLFSVVALVAAASVAVTIPPKTAYAATCDQRVFAYGSTGTCVKYIQRLLNSFPLAGTLAVDGIFGSKTRGTTRSFQSKEHIRVDGIVGPQTWRHLCASSYLFPSNPAGHSKAAGGAGCFR